MKHEDSIYYNAGLLDSRGGFYIVKRKKNKYLYFKIDIKDVNIKNILYNFLTNKLSINARDWKGVINITDTRSVQKLTLFMSKYCMREDYKELIIKHTSDKQ